MGAMQELSGTANFVIWLQNTKQPKSKQQQKYTLSSHNHIQHQFPHSKLTTMPQESPRINNTQTPPFYQPRIPQYTHITPTNTTSYFSNIQSQLLQIPQTDMSDRFSEFLSEIKQLLPLQELLQKAEIQFHLKKYKITEIDATNAFSMHHYIVERFYKNKQVGESNSWVENELRLFIWSVICYMHLRSKTIEQMNESDWNFFGQFFYVRKISLFEYQARVLLDPQIKLSRWSEQEDYTLFSLIIQNKNAKWNEIAKNLFTVSNKQFLRPSKQCRQRWLNHLDPNKTKANWDLREYVILFKQVEEKGKRWSTLARKFNDKRSEHAIKNKYNCIIKKIIRMNPQLTEKDARKEILGRLNNIIVSESLNTQDEVIFGFSAKNRSKMNFQKNRLLLASKNKSQDNTNSNKLEIFRRKIQSISFPPKQRFLPDNFCPSQPKQSNSNTFESPTNIRKTSQKSFKALSDFDFEGDEEKMGIIISHNEIPMMEQRNNFMNDDSQCI